jgi:uncharacterized coiled-coil DUF342 family protein
MLDENDMEKIRQVTADLLAKSVGGRIERVILDGLGEKVTHMQKAGAEAEAAAAESRKQMGTYQERSVQLQAQLKELSAAVREQQSALDALKAEHAALTPKVEELRRERAEHVERVRRALGEK